MRKTIYILILAVLASCGKVGDPTGRLMEFSVSAPGVVTTKAEVTSESLKRAQDPDNVFVYGIKSDGSTSSMVFDSWVNPLVYNNTTGVWNAEYGGKVYEWDPENGYYYRFYAYAYSSNAATTGQQRTLEIDNATNGRQFTVTQPEEGDGSTTVDYLLSYMVNVPKGPYPLVPLNLEHAMAKVEVDVRIANTMFIKESETITDSLVSGISVKIEGIKRKATMLCIQPKLDGEEGSNVWQITCKDITPQTAGYTKTGIKNEENIVGVNARVPDMEFIAIPVTPAEMEGYKLTLTYHGRMSGNDYTYEFDLKEASPSGWISGHKVRYVLTIDNSIHLAGSIVDYEDVDYIEAVIVPDQNKGNDE